MYGSSGDDRFYGLEIYSIIYYGPDSTWSSYARGFETTTVDGGASDAATGAAAGGSDVSYLYDSVTDDSFVGGPLAGRMTYQSGMVIESRRIKQVYAYSTAGGYDTATVYGSSAGDSFYGQELVSVMYYGGDAGWKHYLRSFERVTADVTVTDATTGAMPGGTDEARLYDTALDDLFTASGDEASFDYNYLSDTELEILARGFQRVWAYSINGGTDHKALDGTETFYLYFLGTYWDN